MPSDSDHERDASPNSMAVDNAPSPAQAQAHSGSGNKSPPRSPPLNERTSSTSPASPKPAVTNKSTTASPSLGNANAATSSSKSTNDTTDVSSPTPTAQNSPTSPTPTPGLPAATLASSSTSVSVTSTAPDDAAVAAVANSSSTQLASLLHAALQEAEVLRTQLADAQRRVAKAERLSSTLQGLSSDSGPAAASEAGDVEMQDHDRGAALPEKVVKAIADAEDRAERAERAQQAAEATLASLREQYAQLDKYLALADLRAADARNSFSNLFSSSTSNLVLGDIQPFSISNASSSSSNNIVPSVASAAQTLSALFLPLLQQLPLTSAVQPHPFLPALAHPQQQAQHLQTLPPLPSSSAGIANGGTAFGTRRSTLVHPGLGHSPSSSSTRIGGVPPPSSSTAGAGASSAFQSMPLPPPPSASTISASSHHQHNHLGHQPQQPQHLSPLSQAVVVPSKRSHRSSSSRGGIDGMGLEYEGNVNGTGGVKRSRVDREWRDRERDVDESPSVGHSPHISSSTTHPNTPLYTTHPPNALPLPHHQQQHLSPQQQAQYGQRGVLNGTSGEYAGHPAQPHLTLEPHAQQQQAYLDEEYQPRGSGKQRSSRASFSVKQQQQQQLAAQQQSRGASGGQKAVGGGAGGVSVVPIGHALAASQVMHQQHQQQQGRHYSSSQAQQQQQPQQGYDDRDSERGRSYASHLGHGGHHHHHPHTNGHAKSRHRKGDGRRRSVSRASSVGSSWSIDEMLLEATTDREREQQQQQQQRGEREQEREKIYGIRGDSNASILAGRAEVGPHRDPPSIQSYQTHIFTPPVTGAPASAAGAGAGAGGKKGPSPNPPSSAVGGGRGELAKGGADGGSGKSVLANHMMTLGPRGEVVSGGGAASTQGQPAAALPGGGYPPTNAQGQRICRQCGMAGRYKEGKCVEKWGPGPEGPGTVCDRCRKKMKRVERRGTMDASQASAAQLLTAHASQANGANMRTLPPRQDTVIVSETMPSRERESRTAAPISSSRGSVSYTRDGDGGGTLSVRGRERSRERGGSSSRGLSPSSQQHQQQQQQQQHYGPAASLRTRSGLNNSLSSTNHSHSRDAHSAAHHHRRAPTPPYINSISSREQHASAMSGDEQDVLEADLLDGEGDLDVDAEISRMLPSSSSQERLGGGGGGGGREEGRREGMGGRDRTSTGSSSLSALSGSGSPRWHDRERGLVTSSSSPAKGGGGGVSGPASRHALLDGGGRGGWSDGVAVSKRTGANGEGMDVDTEADADAEADPDADIMDAVDAAGRMKEED